MHGRVPQFRGPHASQRPSKLYTMDQREYNLAPGQPASTLVRVYSVYVFIYLYIYIYIYIYTMYFILSLFIRIELCRAHPWPSPKHVTNETLLIYRLRWSLLTLLLCIIAWYRDIFFFFFFFLFDREEKRTSVPRIPRNVGPRKRREEERELQSVLPARFPFFSYLLRSLYA